MQTPAQDTTTLNAGEALAALLRDPETAGVWDTYYHSKAGHNPASQAADRIEQLGTNLFRDPALASFLLQLIEIEKKSLGKPKRHESSKTRIARTQLQNLEDFFRSEIEASDRPDLSGVIEKKEHRLDKIETKLLAAQKKFKKLEKIHKRRKRKQALRESDFAELEHLKVEKDGLEQKLQRQKVRIEDTTAQQSFLKAYTHHTGQNSLGPTAIAKACWALLQDVGGHVKEQYRERPGKFAVMTAGCLALFVFMRYRMPTSATMYVDPQLLQVENVSLDALDNPDFMPSLSDNPVSGDIKLPWHDHLVQLVGNSAASVLREIPGVDSIAPVHRAKLLNQAENAQARLQWGYDLINLRIDALIKDPADNLGSILIPDSAFKQAFDDATYQAQELICFGNTLENIVLHGLLLCAAFAIAYDAKTLSNEEAKEHWDEAMDFLKRCRANSKLSIAFASAAAGSAAYYYGGFNPAMVWMAAAGLATGENVHRHMRKRSGINNPSNTITASTSFDNFTNPAISSPLTKQNLTISTYVPDILKNKYTWSAASITTAFMILDIYLNKGVYTGTVLGHLAVYIPFVGWNAVEDTGLHGIVVAAGGSSGLAASMISNEIEGRINKRTKTVAPDQTLG